jgi:hypothetical protein
MDEHDPQAVLRLERRTARATQPATESSTRNRGTRENSAALCVTRVRSEASAIDAIKQIALSERPGGGGDGESERGAPLRHDRTR